MAKGVNKVFLLGRLGKDPEMRATAGGMTIANFTLATSDRTKDAQGNWQDHTEWHNLVAFQRTAEIVRDYCKKGSQIFIEGKIQTRSWEDKESGAKKYRTEIIVNDLVLLGGGQRDGEGGGGGGYSGGRSSGKSSGGGGGYDQRSPDDSPAASSSGAPDITDEDIPF